MKLDNKFIQTRRIEMNRTKYAMAGTWVLACAACLMAAGCEAAVGAQGDTVSAETLKSAETLQADAGAPAAPTGSAHPQRAHGSGSDPSKPLTAFFNGSR
jgi:hypothetical protein